MCMFKKPKIPSQPTVATDDNAQAIAAADAEAKLRRRQRGAAANVLTSPTGISSTAKMGGVAQ